MDKKNYCDALGFVVSYKSLDEQLLFNEMSSRIKGLKLERRGKTSSAFYVNDYASVVEEMHKESFIFLLHIHPFMSKRDICRKYSDFDTYVFMMEELLPRLLPTEKIICQCRIDSTVPMEYSNKELTTLLSSFFAE